MQYLVFEGLSTYLLVLLKSSSVYMAMVGLEFKKKTYMLKAYKFLHN